MRVVGTAGHVDHGKSTLVQALSGIDPDRLKEEKVRGMTIDLGFAWVDLTLPDGRIEPVGIVDVPGHIDFIKNMLAGVGGIDAAILVIAADEGVMPQTREHLAILDLLASPHCIVALTKVDLIDDPDWLDLVELDIEDVLAQTRFGGAPIVRVSAATGAGLDMLCRVLGEVLATLEARRHRNRPRLPVDRVFTLSGFGTVVTGTLLDGELAVGEDVEIFPARQRARIRGMQSHKMAVERATPGSRVALNLAGVAAQDLRRGDTVGWPATLQATHLVDVEFTLLAEIDVPLQHNQKLDFFCGASERRAIVRLLGTETLAPGESGWLQLRLDRPTVVLAGDRFILRTPSPSTTVGGGRILHANPGRRWKRFHEEVLQRFERLARGAPDELILTALERAPLSSREALVEQAGIDVASGQEALAQLEARGEIESIAVGNQALVYGAGWKKRLVQTTIDTLQQYHKKWPLRMGIPLGELRARLSEVAGVSINARILAALLESWQAEELVEMNGATVRLPGHRPTPSEEQRQSAQRLLAAYAKQPFSPPTEAEVKTLLQNDEELLAYLLAQEELVRLGGGVLFRTADFAEMMARIVGMLEQQGEISLADVRDQFATSRKFAQAVLEEMDARRITRREGDIRLLRETSG